MKYKTQELPEIGEIEKIFFVGIKGVGVAPLALIADGVGITTAGSDIAEEFITDEYLGKANIPISVGFKTEDINDFFGDTNKDRCLVITTGAHKGFDNPQSIWAKEIGIRILTQGQALALFMEGKVICRENILLDKRLPKTRPAGAGIEFRLAREE